jgi:hypothetical protein
MDLQTKVNEWEVVVYILCDGVSGEGTQNMLENEMQGFKILHMVIVISVFCKSRRAITLSFIHSLNKACYLQVSIEQTPDGTCLYVPTSCKRITHASSNSMLA